MNEDCVRATRGIQVALVRLGRTSPNDKTTAELTPSINSLPHLSQRVSRCDRCDPA